MLPKINFSSTAAYKYLTDQGIIVRNRNKVELCEGCLRITIGTIEENQAIIDSLKKLKND